MSSNGEMTADGGDTVAQSSAKRWVTDSAGRKVYYPYGPAWGGYVVADGARENAICEADRRFDEVSKNLGPYSEILILLLLWAFYYFLGKHPLWAFALFPAALVLAGSVVWLVQRPVRAPLLAGLPRAPAADVAGKLYLQRAGYLILLLIVLIALVLHLYDLRVAAIAANSPTIDFYPDISRYVIFGSIFALILCGLIVRWNKLSANAGPDRAMLGVFLFSLGSLGFFAAAAWDFYDPQPAIVLAQDTLYCGWRARWADIADLSLREGRKASDYARVQFAANRSPFPDSRLTERCAISGLNTNYAEVYEAIHKRWQVTLQSNAASAGVLGEPGAALRAELNQIPPGSSREKVFAVLGESILRGPSGYGLVYLYPRTPTSQPANRLEDDVYSRRVVAVYFDENHRVERVAVYGLSNGKVVVDAAGHEPISTSYEYPMLRNVLLNPRRRW